MWLLAWPAFGLLLLGWSLGHIRGNAVRVSEEQLPEIHALAVRIADGMGLDKLPTLYILQSDGALNAFATKFVRRDFVVLYSDVADLVWEGGEAELAFVLAHEFAHVQRGHPVKQLLTQPVAPLFGLAQAYSRACEFTCDRMAAELVPEGAPDGLLVLAAGKRLYRRVDQAAYVRQIDSETGFWVWLTEKLASHPTLPRRVAALTGDEVRTVMDSQRTATATAATASAV